MLAVLRERYQPPAWAFLTHVRNQTGYSRTTRTADAMAMSLYPSRGLDLHGIEIKVDRADFLRELKDPDKAAELFRFCNRWWVAVSDPEIVQPGELPSTWGLLVPRGKGLAVKVDAPALTPEPISRPFLASIFRNVVERHTLSHEEIEALAEKRVEARNNDEEARHELALRTERRAVENARQDTARLQAAIDKFEAASGVKIHLWEAEKIGEAVRWVREHDPTFLYERLANIRKAAEGIIEAVDRAK
jgi:hypothetical protein